MYLFSIGASIASPTHAHEPNERKCEVCIWAALSMLCSTSGNFFQNSSRPPRSQRRSTTYVGSWQASAVTTCKPSFLSGDP